MLSLKDFAAKGLDYSISCDSIYGGASGDTTETKEVSTNDGCGDTKKTLYREDGTVCCTEQTDYCCPM